MGLTACFRHHSRTFALFIRQDLPECKRKMVHPIHLKNPHKIHVHILDACCSSTPCVTLDADPRASKNAYHITRTALSSHEDFPTARGALCWAPCTQILRSGERPPPQPQFVASPQNQSHPHQHIEPTTTSVTATTAASASSDAKFQRDTVLSRETHHPRQGSGELLLIPLQPGSRPGDVSSKEGTIHGCETFLAEPVETPTPKTCAKKIKGFRIDYTPKKKRLKRISSRGSKAGSTRHKSHFGK